MDKIKNIPRKIYLQVGSECTEPEDDFSILRLSGEISWNDTKVYESDIEYLLPIQLKNESRLIKEAIKWCDDELSQLTIPEFRSPYLRMKQKLLSLQSESEGGKVAGSKWELKSHSYQIADTGDYDGHWEITDGKISIFTKDDDDEALEQVVKILNAYDIDFYKSDEAEYENHLLKQEINQLKCSHPIINKVEEGYSFCTYCNKPFTDNELEEYKSQSLPSEKLGEWQLCPKCNGDGNLMRYNSPNMSTNATPICDVCNGAKILPKPPIK